MLPGVSPDEVRGWSLEDRNNIRLVKSAQIEAQPLIDRQIKKKAEDEEYRKGNLK